MSCVKYNNVIDVSYSPVDPDVYPVSLADMKRHLYLQFDSEGGYSVDDDDTYIEQELIPAAVETIEKFTGILLRPCIVTAILRNQLGGQRLPYGPVTSFIGLTNCNGEAVTDYRLSGLEYKSLAWPTGNDLTATYAAGNTTPPYAVKMAVLHQGASLYRMRGDQQQQYASSNIDISASARRLALPHKKTGWLL